MYMGLGNSVSSQWTIAHGATATQNTAVDALSDPLVRWNPTDVGLLITDVTADGCATPGVDYIDFMLTDSNHWRQLFPSTPPALPIPIGLLVRGDPTFAIVNGEGGSTIYVTVHALSLDRPTYNMLLAKMAIEKPFDRNQGAVGSQAERY